MRCSCAEWALGLPDHDLHDKCLFPVVQCGLGDLETFARRGSWSCSCSACISESHSNPWPVWDQLPGRELHQSRAAPGIRERRLMGKQCGHHGLQESEREGVFVEELVKCSHICTVFI